MEINNDNDFNDDGQLIFCRLRRYQHHHHSSSSSSSSYYYYYYSPNQNSVEGITWWINQIYFN